jgi:hypothetical protein
MNGTPQPDCWVIASASMPLKPGSSKSHRMTVQPPCLSAV